MGEPLVRKHIHEDTAREERIEQGPSAGLPNGGTFRLDVVIEISVFCTEARH